MRLLYKQYFDIEIYKLLKIVNIKITMTMKTNRYLSKHGIFFCKIALN